ncbi:hypothetical protein EC988_009802, partial [Linderina pennispora]
MPDGNGSIGSVGERSSGILEFVSSSVSQTRVIPRLVKINQTSARPPVPQRTSSTPPVLLPPAVVTSLPTQPMDPSQGSPVALAMSPTGSLGSSKSSSGKFKIAMPSPRKLKLRGSKPENVRQEPSAADVPAKSALEIQEHKPTPPPMPPKERFMQGLRRKSSMGSPLIKRALSLKKRSNKDLHNDDDEQKPNRRGKGERGSKRNSVPQPPQPSVSPPKLEGVTLSR